MFGKIVKTIEEAQKEAMEMFKNTNAEIAGWYALPTKKGEWAEYVEWCKR